MVLIFKEIENDDFNKWLESQINWSEKNNLTQVEVRRLVFEFYRYLHSLSVGNGENIKNTDAFDDSIELKKELEEKNRHIEELQKNKEQQLNIKIVEIGDLNERLKLQVNETNRLTQIENNQRQQLRTQEIEMAKLKEELKEKKNEVAILNKPSSLWTWLANRFPNFLIDGENTIKVLDKKVTDLEGKNKEMLLQYEQSLSNNKELSKQIATLQNQQKQWITDEKSLKKEIEDLKSDNSKKMGEIARLSNIKQAESLGGCDKPEDYQIANAYKEFCTKLLLDQMSKEIYGHLKAIGRKNTVDKLQAVAQIKRELSKALLVNVYKSQIRQIRKQKSLFEFDTLFELHGNGLISQFELSEELQIQLEDAMMQSIDLINQLIGFVPPCHFSFADENDIFDPDEHIAATGCSDEGIIKFTVVPGIQSGLRLLMKPVVFTEVL